MKKLFTYILLPIAVITLSNCTATRDRRNNLIERDAILNDIQYYVKSLVNTASYNKKASEVYNAMYIVATKEYNQIVRDSESKGYIEAKQENDTYIESITIEMRGETPPYRVSFQVKKQRRTKDATTGVYTNWTDAGSAPETYITKLQREVYELINGTIHLTQDLQDKVDAYNNKQKTNKTKIL